MLTPESFSFSSHLLEFHLRAGLFQLGLDLFGLILGHAFLDRLGGALDQVLGLFAAAADTPHFSSSIFARSAASRTVRVERSSTSFCRSAIEHPYWVRTSRVCEGCHAVSPLAA